MTMLQLLDRFAEAWNRHDLEALMSMRELSELPRRSSSRSSRSSRKLASTPLSDWALK